MSSSAKAAPIAGNDRSGAALRLPMGRVEVISELECERGWMYRVRIDDHQGASEHSVRLDWAEHELWCGGRCPPSRVVEKLITLLLEQPLERPIPARFDAATARRWWPEVDQVLPLRL
jgi:hypothetical protein